MSSGSATDVALDVVDREEAVALTQEIVRVPSVVGEEHELSDLLTARMKGMGYDLSLIHI